MLLIIFFRLLIIFSRIGLVFIGTSVGVKITIWIRQASQVVKTTCDACFLMWGMSWSRSYSLLLVSIQMVTGPSLMSATCMSAPNSPVPTSLPMSAERVEQKYS